MRSAPCLVGLLLAACSAEVTTIDAGPASPKSAVEILLGSRGALKEGRFRVQLLINLAEALTATGQAEEAKQQLAHALQEIPKLSDPSDRDRALGSAGIALLRGGDRAQAEALAAKLNGRAKSELEAELAETVGQALKIDDGPIRDRALIRLAQRALASKEIDQAGNAVARIQDTSDKAPLVGALAKQKLEAGRQRDVENWLRELEALPRAETQSALAVWSIERGNAKAAARFTKSIEPDLVRVRCLALQSALTSGDPSRRLLEAAEKAAADIRSAPLQAAAIEAIVRAWIDKDPALAKAILARSKKISDRALKADIVAGLARRGELAQAEALLSEIEGDPVEALPGIAALARAHLKAGDRASALATLRRIPQLELSLPVVAEIAVGFGAAPSEAEAAALRGLLGGR